MLMKAHLHKRFDLDVFYGIKIFIFFFIKHFKQLGDAYVSSNF